EPADPGLLPGGDEVLQTQRLRQAERCGEDLPGALEGAVEGPDQRQHDQQRPDGQYRMGDDREDAVAGGALPPAPGRGTAGGGVLCCRGAPGPGTRIEALCHHESFRRKPNSTITAISMVTSASTTPMAEARPNWDFWKAVSYRYREITSVLFPVPPLGVITRT